MPLPLGDAHAVGVADPQNLIASGNYTVTFDPKTIGVTVGSFECYHMVIEGPPGSTFKIFVGTRWWDNVNRGDVNSWDPNQTLKLHQGDTVYFYWSAAPPALPVPNVTMFFQEANPL